MEVVSARQSLSSVGTYVAPDLDALVQAQARIDRLRELQGHVRAAAYLRSEADKAADSWTRSAVDADAGYRDTLIKAGRCPTCGQAVRG